jgi:hypothetical protein
MDRLLPPGRQVPQAGVYEDGLLVVLRADDAEGFLRSWSWLVGDNAKCLLTTGFGDVFYWARGAVRWLNVQRATTEAIDSELGWVLDEFLDKEIVETKMLRRPILVELTRRKRSLRYHEAFILDPWLIMGGEERVENYVIGHCGVYVDLVGQTWPQLQRQGKRS